MAEHIYYKRNQAYLWVSLACIVVALFVLPNLQFTGDEILPDSLVWLFLISVVVAIVLGLVYFGVYDKHKIVGTEYTWEYYKSPTRPPTRPTGRWKPVKEEEK